MQPVTVNPIAVWTANSDVDPPTGSRARCQKEWGEPLVNKKFPNLLSSADITDKARLRAAASKKSGAWLDALPVSSLGNLLDNDGLRISVGLRLGANLCEEHTCKCGATVNTKGHHGLSCRFSAGRHSRHGAINGVIQRALTSAGFQAVREPNGLSRGDGKRPDGMTRTPWKLGRSLLWDVTVVDTLAQSHIGTTSATAGAAADKAEELKTSKYQALADRYIFTPIGLETFGSWGTEAFALIKDIGQKLTSETGEQRATSFLVQKISIELQRGNAGSILGTFPNSRGLEEIFYVLRSS